MMLYIVENNVVWRTPNLVITREQAGQQQQQQRQINGDRDGQDVSSSCSRDAETRQHKCFGGKRIAALPKYWAVRKKFFDRSKRFLQQTKKKTVICWCICFLFPFFSCIFVFSVSFALLARYVCVMHDLFACSLKLVRNISEFYCISVDLMTENIWRTYTSQCVHVDSSTTSSQFDRWVTV